MSIWTLCNGKQFITPIAVEPWRVVEAQHILSARDLVDSREEHDLLEDLIEQSKPSIAKEKNYLIFTPFRYPPLNHGSRFGSILEPSLWYGSLQLETAFTEVAYYRLKFFNDTSADLGYIEISMTAFVTSIATLMGIDLTQTPFSDYHATLFDKNSYEQSQALGACMREDHIEAVIYCSARTHEITKNIAAFTPSVFQLKKGQHVHHQQNWKCLANKHLIEFTRIGISGKQRYCFDEHYFL